MSSKRKALLTTGKRKTSKARIVITEGKGRVRVNNTPIHLHEPQMAREKIMESLVLAGDVAEKVDITKKQAALFLEELADLACKESKNSFTLPGLGKLVLVNRKARMGRNPATGEAIKIPAKKVVKFRVSKVCKDAILGAGKKKAKKKAKKSAKKRR